MLGGCAARILLEFGGGEVAQQRSVNEHVGVAVVTGKDKTLGVGEPPLDGCSERAGKRVGVGAAGGAHQRLAQRVEEAHVRRVFQQRVVQRPRQPDVVTAAELGRKERARAP